jgi:alkylation response protein AidB-like acyl-CoA dehydrogenase
MAFDLALDTGQEALADLVGRFFSRECPAATVRAAEPLGFSVELWQRCCELGLAGMGVAEAVGGGGASMRDLVLVAEAAGTALAPVPFVEHAVATRRFPQARLVTGDAIATIALHPAVDGRWRLVPAGAIADVVLGVDGDDLVAVTAEPPGCGPRNHGDAPLADRSTAGERVRLGAASELGAVLVEWKLLTAALLSGLAARALALGTTYAKDRHQFGRPIGAFQAVQHGLAECVGPVEGARLLARKAAWALDTGPGGEVAMTEGEVDDPAILASMAFAFATDAATATTKRALQYHGAYGFSTEYDIQLYHRRARGWPLAYRGARSERQHLADLCWPATGS